MTGRRFYSLLIIETLIYSLVHPYRYAANVEQPSVDEQPGSEMKKKHKKHKKDKKNKKHKRSSPVHDQEHDRSQPSHPARDDSMHPNSDFHYGSSISQNNENVVVHVGSSDGSNSPKYNLNANYPSRSSSPTKMSLPAMRKRTSIGSSDDQNFWHQNVPATREKTFNEQSAIASSVYNAPSTMSAYGEVSTTSTYNDINVTVPTDTTIANEQPQPPATGKKRGRKKGSKGIDTQLGSKSSSSQQQSGTQYFDSLSLSTLKDKMESIRSSSKKVKTINELVADLGIMRNLSTIDDDDTVDEAPSRSSYSE